MYCILDLETIVDNKLIYDVHKTDTNTFDEAKADFDAKLEESAKFHGGKPFPPLAYHKPVCACLLVVDANGGYVNHRVLLDPNTIVADFWSCITEGLGGGFFSKLITFNGRRFDLPVMELRAIQAGLRISDWLTIGRKGWEDPRSKLSNVHLDLIEMLYPDSRSAMSGLDVVAKMFGFPGKTNHGSHVDELFKAGKMTDIGSYCMCDVLNTYGAAMAALNACGEPTPRWGDDTAMQRVVAQSLASFPRTPELVAFAKAFAASKPPSDDEPPF